MWQAAAAAGGASLLGGLIGVWQNKKQRQHELSMYNLARGHNLEQWHRQNEYNSPEKYMQRLKAGGLNPHLALQGGANFGAAGPIQSPQRPQGQFGLPQVDIANMADSFFKNVYKLETDQANLDVMKAQADSIRQDIINKAHQVLLADSQTELNRQTKDHRSKLIDSQVDLLKENVNKTKQDQYIAGNKEHRDAIAFAPNLQGAFLDIVQKEASIAQTWQQTRNLRKLGEKLKYDTNIRRLESKLADQGILPGSPWYVKSVEMLVSQLLDRFKNTDYSIIQKSKSPVEDMFKSSGSMPKMRLWNKGSKADQWFGKRGSFPIK